MTKKLYYEDAYLRSFTATVERTGVDDKGRHFVVLDQTLFYPTGGGQPHDTGTIDDIEVYDVEEVEGEIRHYVKKAVQSTTCTGEINWVRRFDHMQQHAGQHILSAIFADHYHYETIGFHLGEEVCTVDLNTQQLHELEYAEELMNQIILENLPINTKWVKNEELEKFPLRKNVSVKENIRLVIIPNVDYNGCGGTHPNTTGQVGMIHILDWEKLKKNTIRVSFICGNRIRKQLYNKHQVIKGMTNLLNVPQEQLEERTSSTLQLIGQLKESLNDLKAELFTYEARDYLREAVLLGKTIWVSTVFMNKDTKELQQLAKAISEDKGNVIVFFANQSGQQLQVLCSKGKDIPLSMKDLIQYVISKIDGKGGGSEFYAQGVGKLHTSADALLEVTQNFVSEQLSTERN